MYCMPFGKSSLYKTVQFYKDNNPIFPAMPLNHTQHCHTTIGPLDPPIQTCAPPTRAITQSVISGPGMLWK